MCTFVYMYVCMQVSEFVGVMFAFVIGFYQFYQDSYNISCI